MGICWARSSALALFSLLLAAPAWAAGQLVLESNPPGAAVSLNGQSLGETPLVHEGLRAGTHQVTLTRPGYRPVTLRVTIQNDLTTRQRVSMTPERRQATGELVIESKPSGADVYLDGRWLGKTPLHVPVAVGTHRLSLRYPGYEALARTVRVVSDLTTTQRVTLAAIAPEAPPPLAMRPMPEPDPPATPTPAPSPMPDPTPPPTPTPVPSGEAASLPTAEPMPPPAAPAGPEGLPTPGPTIPPTLRAQVLPFSPAMPRHRSGLPAEAPHEASRPSAPSPARIHPRPTPRPYPRSHPGERPQVAASPRSASPVPVVTEPNVPGTPWPGVTRPDFKRYFVLPEWKLPTVSFSPPAWLRNPLADWKAPRLALPEGLRLPEASWEAHAERARHAGFSLMMLGFVATLGHALWRQRATPLDWQPDIPSAGFHLLPEGSDEVSLLAAQVTQTAILRAERGNWPQAIADLREAFRLVPAAETAYNLALAWELTGMEDWAEVAYRTALQLVPDHRDAGLNLANLLVARAQPLEAWVVYRTLAERHPEDGAIAYNRGNLLASMGQLAPAMRELKRARRFLPTDPAPAANLRCVRRRRMAAFWARALQRGPRPR